MSLASLARDLLLAFFDVCAHAGLDRVLAELAQAFPPLDPTDRSALASHDAVVAAVVAQLETIDLDGGGPRGTKPRQLADCVVAALGLTPVDEPDRTIALDDAVRVEVTRALATVVDVELAAPKLRVDIIADARARCDARYHAAFDRVAAQLDERGLHLVKQAKVPIDALHAAQYALFEARNAVIARIAGAALDRAREVLARADGEAGALLDQPITLRATPREVAILRACDARVSKTPARVLHSLLDSLTDLLRIAWRAPVPTAIPYAASGTFAVGDVIDHPKFGRGKVIASAMKRIDVEFADGTHTLVHVPSPR
ncbi:MAG: hypothetical protein E6J90_20830 [Deltaproteobacteria bacterium]|nr:MAG: hypothetical protein E6J91_50105 [Deltaproteobacteria bacterium]TMQ18148.1 MAG: hypothetical protein E6J90_20830 [Deltaproteobacteria bacterium]